LDGLQRYHRRARPFLRYRAGRTMAKTDRGSDQHSNTLQAALRALDAGDVVAARRLAATVVADPTSPAAAAEAQDLLRRTDVAWPVLLFGAFAGVLLLAFILLAVVRSAHP
jgi:hypothetical protein